MSIAYLGVGSNLGDRQNNIDTAKSLLLNSGIHILKCSSVIETHPQGGPPGQPKYLNGVIQIETAHAPEDLLSILKSIERALGRISNIKNGPRPIDLDILLYDNLTIQTPHLTIPHPRMWDRDFVLVPLTEIAPVIVEGYCHARH